MIGQGWAENTELKMRTSSMDFGNKKRWHGNQLVILLVLAGEKQYIERKGIARSYLTDRGMQQVEDTGERLGRLFQNEKLVYFSPPNGVAQATAYHLLRGKEGGRAADEHHCQTMLHADEDALKQWRKKELDAWGPVSIEMQRHAQLSRFLPGGYVLVVEEPEMLLTMAECLLDGDPSGREQLLSLKPEPAALLMISNGRLQYPLPQVG